MIACFLMPHIAIATERSRVPGLWGEPLALTTEDEIVVCVSQEAQPYGVAPGQKSAGAKALCPQLKLLPYERAIYEQAAALVWDGIAVESSVVEPYSPEICYAEVDDRHVSPRLRSFSEQLARAAHMCVQVGAGSSKLVARQAALHGEPQDPVIVFPGSEKRLLADVELESLQVLDAAMLRRLLKMGVRTLGDIQVVSLQDLHRAVGRQALRLSRLAIGLDSDPVLPSWPRPTHTAIQMFEFEVTQQQMVMEAVRRCSVRLERALRGSRQFCTELTLQLIRPDRSMLEMQERLPSPAQASILLYSSAERILGRMGDNALSAGLDGIALAAQGLCIPGAVQLELLDVHGNGLPAERKRKLDAAFEYMRSKFGTGSVLSAATMHRVRRIDHWVTPFCHQRNEPVEVEAGPDGIPLRFWRMQRLYCVRTVLQDWCETFWSWNELVRATVFRIETEPPGLFELKRLGNSWRLTASQD